MLISFSGLDGAGKTTQIELLLNTFRKAGLRTGSVYDIYSDIRYHSIADLTDLQEYLEKFDAVHLRFRLNSDENSLLMADLEYSDFQNLYLAKAVALQGYFDHAQLYRYVVFPLLEKGKTILSDRYYYDEIVFKCVYGCDYSVMRKMYMDCRKPDLAFYIAAHPQDIFRRNVDRPDGKTTLYRDISHILQLTKLFEQLTQDSELIRIDGTRSRNDVHKQILSTFEGADFPLIKPETC